ncbi:SulP family inorganic anion transporter [Luteibaculum oceani]|uniref:SulP family inorganic anion transporter n=1 Tax=Luteibaculum oceani TaxID=1294296 RepID=A0A5C6UUD6_9FLAO|nr:SulP family inorganic anion transporter [Luteibaculum oceani]TXC76204.1 SulP family inorganic anion transporter [Luteibaculum oceani]
MSYFKEDFKYDLTSSIVVFLVALPLCLGIALASEAPLISGLISGIIGGIIIGFFSKSSLSVSGPAAGLVVIVLDNVEALGGYEPFLVAVSLAGLLQLILGFAKAGIIGLYFPTSVIRGMLAAIGLILILKQIPHLVGFDSDAFGEMEFFQADGNNTFSAIIASLENFNNGSFVIGIICLGLLVLWESKYIKGVKALKQIPGSVLAVAIGLILNQIFISSGSALAIGKEHLVSIPILSGEGGLTAALKFPDFSAFSNYQTYVTTITLAIVASLETLLSIEAVDKLDPHKRHTPKNAELKAQGIGNFVSGLIGGLPITAVIVRSSANLDSGAKTKMSAIMHGIWLLLAVAFFPTFMNQIPLASLAAILIVVGWKLTKPSIYKKLLAVGQQQFIPFVVTILAILFTDLLIGIIIGLVVGIFYILRANYKVPYNYSTGEFKTDDGREAIKIELSEHVSFLNKARLQTTLDGLPNGCHVMIDGSRSKEIEFDAMEVIEEFRINAPERDIVVSVKDLPGGKGRMA